MKCKFFTMLLSLAALVCLCLGITACDTGPQSAGKSVPVYQGMTISSPSSRTSASALAAGGNSGDSGNHYGWYKDKDVDQDDPFGGEDVEDVLDDSLTVEGSAAEIYYTVPNEDIYIIIHINNPDKFEILSFTLNDEKYSSYMFESGSDMENIILKKNVGEVSGIVEYTIDAIKYVDGTIIKDVLIDGDKTVRAGVKTQDQVTAAVSEKVGFDEISLTVSVEDRDGLIAYSDGSLKAVLYDGEILIAEKEIEVGESKVTFGGLELGSLYQYAVVGRYDDLASGKDWHVLYKKAVYTETTVIFHEIVVAKDSVSFSFLWHEDAEVTGISSLRLIDSGKEEEKDPKATSLGGLLSDHEYTLAATFLFNGEEKEIKYDFHTIPNAVPEVELKANGSTQTTLGFEVSVTDNDHVGEISKIELLDGDEVKETLKDLTLREFTDLLSDHDYTVSLTYTYDLNDGNGPKSITVSANVTTYKMEMPSVRFDHLFVTENSIKADLNCEDPDGTVKEKTVKLSGPNNLTHAGEKIDFTDLVYGETYIVTVAYVYDLNDGMGAKSSSESLSVTINSKSIHETSCILDHEEYEGGYRITGYSNCHHDEIYIPDSIDGVRVLSIGAYAFRNCTAKQIEIGQNVYAIGERAFYNCTSLTEFTIPENISFIDSQIFIGCQNLKTVHYNSNASRTDSVLNISSIDTVIFGNNLTWIPSNVCYNCTNITTVILSENTISIGNYAFFHCTGLKQIKFPEGLVSTGFYAFEESGLTSIVLPSTVTDVSASFRDCWDLTYVVIPESLRKIEGQAFYVCNALQAIYYMGSDFEWEVVSIDPINDVFLRTPVYFYSYERPQTEGNFWHYVEGVPTLWFEKQ